MRKLRLFEFFAGGGMVHAAAGPRWSVPFANDFSSMKARTYRANWGPRYLRLKDIGVLSTTDLPGQADLAWASSPCQDVSLAGVGAGLGLGLDGLPITRSGTFWHWWGLMEGLRAEGRAPKTLILENVTGLLTSNDGADLQAVCQAFAAAGYTFGPIVVDAALFLPHSRPRLFLIAILDPIAASRLPQSPEPVKPWHTSSMKRAKDALGPEYSHLWRWWNPSQPQPMIHSLESILEDDEAVDWNTLDQTQNLLGMMQPPNYQKVTSAVEEGGRSVGTLYRRTRKGVQCAEVRFDGISGCLRTPTGGSSKQTVIVVDRGTVKTRLLTPREGARLMGLPDTYKLPESNTDALHIIGDGVALPVVRYLLDHFIEPAVRRVTQQNGVAAEVILQAAD